MNSSYDISFGFGASIAAPIFAMNHAMSARSSAESSYRTFTAGSRQFSGNSARARLKNEYDSVAAQYSKMNRHASAEHVELLLAAMPRGVEEQRRRRDAEELVPTLKVHIKELEDAGVNDDELVEAREALAKAQRDARRRVVDLGCGAGRDYPAFEERNIDYLGVDASEGMLTVARERFPEATFEAQDLCALNLPERSFDGAFANTAATAAHASGGTARPSCTRSPIKAATLSATAHPAGSSNAVDASFERAAMPRLPKARWTGAELRRAQPSA